MKEFRKGNLITATIAAVLGMHLVKISVCFLLMRFVQHKIYKRLLWGIIGKSPCQELDKLQFSLIPSTLLLTSGYNEQDGLSFLPSCAGEHLYFGVCKLAGPATPRSLSGKSYDKQRTC